jgi:cysteine-rich repeat protein
MRTRHDYHFIILAAFSLTGAAACSAAAPANEPFGSNAGGGGGSGGDTTTAVTGTPSQASPPALKQTLQKVAPTQGGVAFSGNGVLGSESSSSSSSGAGGAGGDPSTSSSSGAGGAGGDPSTSSSSGAGGAGGGSGTSSSSGGTTVVPALPVISDTCAGVTFTLAPGRLTVHGTTIGAADDYQPFCASSSGPDVVYAITVPQAGSLWAAVSASPGSTLQPVLDLRTDCASVYMCSDFGAGSTAALVSDVPAGTYYLIVDGKDDTSGDFDLRLQFGAAQCGDGVLNAGEECDVGEGIANDGCGDPGQPDACKLQVPSGNGDQCPGQLVDVSAGTTVLTAASGNSTYGFQDDYDGSCSYYPGGRDRVYRVVPAQSGTMTVSVGYEEDGKTSICDADLYDPRCWGYQLYVRSSCEDAASELGCAMDADWPVKPESLSFPVTAGSPYFVFVDGYDDGTYSTGVFNLVLSLE